MPSYPWLFKDDLDQSNTRAKIGAMRTLGVPYPEGYEKIADADLKAQAKTITEGLMADSDVQKMLKSEGISQLENKEIIALIAYLQRLGKDIKNTPTTASN